MLKLSDTECVTAMWQIKTEMFDNMQKETKETQMFIFDIDFVEKRKGTIRIKATNELSAIQYVESEEFYKSKEEAYKEHPCVLSIGKPTFAGDGCTVTAVWDYEEDD